MKFFFIRKLITLLVFLIPAVCQAQFTFGIKAAYVNTGLSSSSRYVLSAGNSNDFSAGVFVRAGGRFFFEPELLYSRSRLVLELLDPGTVDGPVVENYKSAWQQIYLPLLAGFHIFESRLLKTHVLIGPELTFSLDKPNNLFSNRYNAYNWKSYNYNAVFDLGVDIARVGLDASYNLGLGRVNEGLEARMRQFVFSVSYRF